MDKWLDSLSEDWVSQPRSPHSQQLQSSSSLLGASSPSGNSSQSRIPRYKAGKLPSEAAQTSRKSSRVPRQPSHDMALRERSPSKLNSSHGGNIKAAKPGKSTERARLPGRRHASTGSVPSVPHDTVQHKVSRVFPAKENEPGGTPDWKRRVLQGKAGGHGPDLFAPIGLEAMFKPPTMNQKAKVEKKRRGKPFAMEEFPSSPPPFPSEIASLERSEVGDRRRSSLLRQMEILDDIDEAVSGESSGEELQSGKGTVAIDLPAHEDVGAEPDGNENLSRIVLPRDKDHLLGYKEPEMHSISAPANAQQSLSNDARQRFQNSPALSVDSKIQLHDWTSHSLPDDLSTGTDMCAANGAFVSVRRGGYSSDDSFQRRPLSPSSLPDFDASDLRSPSPSNRRQSFNGSENKHDDRPEEYGCSAPVTPSNGKSGQLNTPGGPRSSGSPLKLFDKYDTFTNDRLVRRMSKFEQSLHENEDVERAEAGQFSDKVTGVAEIGSATHQTAKSSAPPVETDEEPEKRRISSFGDGDLDGHQFDTAHPLGSADRCHPTANCNPSIGDSHSNEDAFRFNKGSGQTRRTSQTLREQKSTQAASGKRQSHSPAKESKAKRRRTLRSSEEMRLDIHQYAENNNLVDQPLIVAKSETNTKATPGLTSPSPNHSIAGKKRKDARYDSTSQLADPKVLAMRQILRPRTSTPSLKGSQNRRPMDGDPLVDHGQKSTSRESKVETPTMNLDHQTQALAGELATFTLNMAHDMSQGARKASVTTADFFNEAKQIMQLIRNQGRPQSSHGILEEPEEPEEPEDVDSGNLPRAPPEQSTIDELSRPPSREGGSIRRLREPAQVDPRVASHLRKFEDTDDLGLALPSSVKSLPLEPLLEMISAVDVQPGTDFEDVQTERDPPNVRILEQEIEDQGDMLCNSALHAPRSMTNARMQSSGSQSTDGPPTSRSVPTGSSRSSTGKAVIAPQVISHLLSDNVGGMTFDHTKQVWVKRKSSQHLSGREAHSRSGSEITEDFFQDIPDLSIDEFQEKQRTQRPPSSKKSLSSASVRISDHDHAFILLPEDQCRRPQTRGSAATSTVDQGSAPSKLFHSASSGAAPETRATSWGDDAFANKALQTAPVISNNISTVEKDEHMEEAEHEINILGGRISEKPQRHGRGERQARVITVAFSSPLVDQIQTLNHDDEDAVFLTDESDLDLSDSPPLTRSQSNAKGRTSHGFRKKSVYRSGSRRASVVLPRPMSRVDENEELSFSQSFVCSKDISMDLMVTTPLPQSRNSLVPPLLSSTQRSGIGFQLSPLSEFTVHKSDDLINRDMSHVARRRGLLSMHEVEDKLSLAAQDIVKRLTDIQPYEPHWDFLRQVNLHSRNLITLHMLDEFCSRIEYLDVSGNELGQLNGAPASVRQLKANGNYLTDLTSWGHLQNLQFLDVSQNNIRKLEGFQESMHLRELRANQNEVESLDGILNLNGLTKLSLRSNLIKAVNFEAYSLIRLTHLDLHGNRLRAVMNLHNLPALEYLNLSNNELTSLPSLQHSQLRTLNLAGNSFQALDISGIFRLQTLNIDRNSISTIGGLATHKSLQVVYWREQSAEVSIQIQWHDCHNLQSLHLSGNIFPNLEFESFLLSLQHLELASTGLQSLPDDFGLRCPNLRTLNLNFNALSELRPLVGIVALQRLYLAGNRIGRLRRTAAVLDRIGTKLEELDLRQNPLTLGSYLPQPQTRVSADKSMVVSSRPMAFGNKTGIERVDDESFTDAEAAGSTYLLPGMDNDADNAARERLDEDTKIRRRVYEMLVALKCRQLKVLDGLQLDRRRVVAKDKVRDRLKELGVLIDR